MRISTSAAVVVMSSVEFSNFEMADSSARMTGTSSVRTFDQQRTFRLAAGELDLRNTGQADKSEFRDGIGFYRCAFFHANACNDFAGIFFIQLQVAHFPDIDAVVLHYAAFRQPGNGFDKHDIEIVELSVGAILCRPQGEHDRSNDYRQRECTDEHMIGTGFHIISPANVVHLEQRGHAGHENIPAPRGGQTFPLLLSVH